MDEVKIQKAESLWDQLQRMEDQITRRAYDLFLSNGSQHGSDLQHWLTAERETIWKPAMEMRETDDQFEIQIAVPGMSPKDISVEVTENDLLVKGEMKTEENEKNKEEKGESYTRESQTGTLFRSIQFPTKIDPDKVKARIKDGVLNIAAPISQDAKSRKVTIQAA
jgi:HSP20 family protein